MRKVFILLAATAGLLTMHAQTVDCNTARSAARNFLSVEEPSLSTENISLYSIIYDNSANPAMFVFNIDSTGFIITGADMHVTPIVGYSLNGAFDTARIPDNLSSWLTSNVDEISEVRSSQSASNAQPSFIYEWKQLATDTYLQRSPSKGVNALLTSSWDQGYGYNNYCPTYPSGFNGSNYNGRSLTGCVATAMAQIIRYHGYPEHGFSNFGYTHGTYGYQHVAFDSAFYDYNNMPNSINYYSSTAQKNAVSLLCYHCGVSVKMDYEGPNHTTGSGAHSEDVPNGLKYFGYTKAYYMAKPANSSSWDSLLKNDLDNSRPVYYSGSSSEGGHAFVCDGYRDNGTYHFNFGWSGYGDGYYSLSNLNGYSARQGAVFNIVPSNYVEFRDTIFIDAEANGSGASWDDAYPDIESALQICSLYKRGTLWVKNGTYYGNTSADYAFTLQKNVKIYGGFAGTEQSIDERDLTNANTVMSGDNKRAVLISGLDATNAAVFNMIFANGYAKTGSGLNLTKGARIENCIIENNTSTSNNGAALDAAMNSVYNCIIRNNIGGGVNLADAKLFNSLVVHNDGYGVRSQSGLIDGCDIVCNSGVGIYNLNGSKIRNSIVWRNDSSLFSNDITAITFSAIDGFEGVDSNSNIGISKINRPTDGIGPFFINPDTTVGPSETMGDWHLSSLSPLVNAGDTMHRTSYETDLDGGGRFRSGRIDIGCYEWVPGNGINTIADKTSFSIHPNPASTHIVVQNADSHIAIYDMMGRLMLRTSANDNAYIDISSLPRGIYILRSGNATARLVKK